MRTRTKVKLTLVIILGAVIYLGWQKWSEMNAIEKAATIYELVK